MRSGHAAIVGGSVAGLLAAGAAAKHFDRVTVLERDALEDRPAPRKGTPQGNQIHLLLPSGMAKIDQVFPGLHRELVDEGCFEYQLGADLPVYTKAGWRVRADLPFTESVGFRRPLLEWVIRRRLLRLDRVTIREATACGLILDEDDQNVVGVRLKGGDQIEADFVIDAGGRGTKAPKWLRELGFEAPERDEVRVYMGYATQFIRIPEGVLEAGVQGVAAMPEPGGSLTGGVLLPADNGLHALAAAGMMKHYPPADRAGMIEFLEGAPSPLLAEIARRSEPASEVRTYRMPGNLRRRWEDLERRPGGLIVIGDAVASFNPIHGQGVTIAAVGAVLLEEILGTAASGDPAALSSSFQEALRSTIDVAFAMAASGDSTYEGAEVRNFTAPSEEENEAGDRLVALLTHDPTVLAAVMEMIALLRPEVLESEAIKAKLAEQAASPRPALELDPSRYPRDVFTLPVQTREEPT